MKAECIDSGKVKILEIDLVDPEKVLKIAESYNLTDRIDILVNNGGISMREEFIKTDFKTCQMMMNTNCMSHIALIKGLLPRMIA